MCITRANTHTRHRYTAKAIAITMAITATPPAPTVNPEKYTTHSLFKFIIYKYMYMLTCIEKKNKELFF